MSYIQNGGLTNVPLAVEKTQRTKCSFCGLIGASVKCTQKNKNVKNGFSIYLIVFNDYSRKK